MGRNCLQIRPELNSERIILRITSFPAACGGVSERIKSTIFLTPVNGISPTKGDKCVNEIIFC